MNSILASGAGAILFGKTLGAGYHKKISGHSGFYRRERRPANRLIPFNKSVTSNFDLPSS